MKGLTARRARDQHENGSSAAPQARKAPSIASRLTAEVAGTFILTLVAAGADVVDGVTAGTIGHAARYLAPGLVLVALIFAFSGISGAHFNPAVTLAFVVRRVFPIRLALVYWLCQLAGAVAAGLALVAVFGAQAHYGVTRIGLEISPLAAFGVETVLTAILVTVILGTCEEEAVVGKNAAIAVGFTVAACGLFSSPLTGASMNPARSLGPALATQTFTDWWLYVAGPLAGALLATALVQIVYGSATPAEHKAAHGKDT